MSHYSRDDSYSVERVAFLIIDDGSLIAKDASFFIDPTLDTLPIDIGRKAPLSAV